MEGEGSCRVELKSPEEMAKEISIDGWGCLGDHDEEGVNGDVR